MDKMSEVGLSDGLRSLHVDYNLYSPDILGDLQKLWSQDWLKNSLVKIGTLQFIGNWRCYFILFFMKWHRG